MARIRSIKPEFFRHEVLQDLEIANPGKYPLMVFAGLWGHCDNKGRFEWKPRQLKLDILPFLPFDMAETLAILDGAEMVRHYTVDGKEYGEIPTFEKHQRLSGKELTEGEKFPPNPNCNREAMGKQRGSDRDGPESQEGKGKEEEGNGNNPAPEKPAPGDVPEDFMVAWKAYPSRPGSSRADSLKAWRARINAGADPKAIIAGVMRYAAFCKDTGTAPQYIKQPATFFGPGEHYLSDWTVPPAQGSPPSATSGRGGIVANYAAQAAAARGEGDGRGTAANSERDITGDCSRVA